ncbi:MAG: hypothetical protein ABSG28_08555 [Methanoregula sp.]|jgi:hypothetical protein|uniref:hypothetical protein n=1 Tax=Methanoregula sp. TaxID=2052170 RepID=UPI003C148A2E
MKSFDNLTNIGKIICICGCFPFIIGLILIVPLIPVAFSHFTIITGTTSFDPNQMTAGFLNPTVIDGIAYCGLGLSFIAIGALFQKPENHENIP